MALLVRYSGTNAPEPVPLGSVPASWTKKQPEISSNVALGSVAEPVTGIQSMTAQVLKGKSKAYDPSMEKTGKWNFASIYPSLHLRAATCRSQGPCIQASEIPA